MEIVAKFYPKHFFAPIIELSWICILLVVLLSILASHPLILCLRLILFTLGLSPLISFILNKWLAYAIILIFLGGIIVLFIYVSTLAGNEKIALPIKARVWLLPVIAGLVALPTQDSGLLLISHLYLNISVALLFFLTLYLLCTLIVVVFLSQGFKGALMTYN